MTHTITVRMPLDYDAAVVERVLERPALPVTDEYPVAAPWITIDGRVHRPTSDFLRQHCARTPNLATARRIASDLASWLDYLCNDCGLHPYEDGRDPVFAATEDHFARYYRQRQYEPGPRMMTSEGWGRAASSLKRLYEYCQRAYRHASPFRITSFALPNGGRGTTIAQYRPRRRKTGSAGVPLTPHFAELLVMGALRVDLDGRQDLYGPADRDAAIISLALATGMRRNSLANLTTYEVPPTSELAFTTMGVPSLITKGGAGGDALAFSYRMTSVHDYMDGWRKDRVATTEYRPERPLRIEHADRVTVEFVDPFSGTGMRQRWDQTDAETRRRLINADGSSCILFLSQSGRPLTYSALQHPVDGAAHFVRKRIDARFPDPFRLHDLRHTYAVHLTVAIFQGLVAEAVQSARRQQWTVDHIAAAVEIVKYSLGHASEASTRLYIQAAHRFLQIPAIEFIGGH